MIIRRYVNIKMSDRFFFFLGKRTPRPCVVWFLLGVIPVFVDQKALRPMG